MTSELAVLILDFRFSLSFYVVVCDSLLSVTVYCIYDMILYDMIYLLTAIGLTPSGNSIVHIYTQTIHRTTQ
jgi:hypothetical protein